jgi:hypothetical protein
MLALLQHQLTIPTPRPAAAAEHLGMFFSRAEKTPKQANETD